MAFGPKVGGICSECLEEKRGSKQEKSSGFNGNPSRMKHVPVCINLNCPTGKKNALVPKA